MKTRVPKPNLTTTY